MLAHLQASRWPDSAGAAPGKPVELPKVKPIRRELPKVGRNDIVTIRKGPEEKTLKFKKAEAMIQNDGWDLVQNSISKAILTLMRSLERFT